jgi:transporter family protein
MWLVFALLSAVFASLVSIFAKLGLKNVDSTLATGIRSVIMALFMVGVVIATDKLKSGSLQNIEPKDWLLIILSGVAGAVSWIFYFSALRDGEASKVAPLDKLSLVFVVVFAALFLKEKLELTGIIGVVLMSVGAVLLVI